MKNIIATTILTTLFATTHLFGQYSFMTTIQGQNGINADISLTFNNIVVNTANCSNGFNYQIEFDYDVNYNQVGVGNGNSHLNTLQGYLACGSNNQSFFNLPNGGGTGTAMTANNWSSLTNCNSIQVSDVMCDEIDLVVQGPGVPYQVIRLEAISSLPVDFIDFNGKSSTDGIILNWSTASEKNNDYFVIERSTDGKNWQLIKEVKGAGTTSERSDYKIKDHHTSSLVYYTLKQVDFDGTTKELETIAVENEFAIQLSAYPNPATDFLKIKGISQPADLMIIDATGKEQTDIVSISTTSDNTLTVDVSSLRPGIYFIRSTIGQLRFIKK